jgi:ABC-type phosphate transport system permease subunit
VVIDGFEPLIAHLKRGHSPMINATEMSSYFALYYAAVCGIGFAIFLVGHFFSRSLVR